jgi:hypothetical protein
MFERFYHAMVGNDEDFTIYVETLAQKLTTTKETDGIQCFTGLDDVIRVGYVSNDETNDNQNRE